VRSEDLRTTYQRSLNYIRHVRDGSLIHAARRRRPKAVELIPERSEEIAQLSKVRGMPMDAAI
jgi:hypothetical protein